jgi:hypothetical protein
MISVPLARPSRYKNILADKIKAPQFELEILAALRSPLFCQTKNNEINGTKIPWELSA